MTSGARLGIFGVVLAALFATGSAIGAVAGPIGDGDGDGDRAGAEHADGHDAAVDPGLPGGLAVAQDGLRLDVATDLAPGATFRFRIVDSAGAPVTEFDVRHDRPLHLVLVSRDLFTYRHLHPEMDGAGVWSVGLDDDLPAGSYRVYADFQAGGHEPVTLAADLAVPGALDPVPVPEPNRSTVVDGHTVELSGTATLGESELRFTVSAPAGPVELEPYLGSRGHLVAIRAADMAYLHVHPLDADERADAVTFAAELPSAGTYRLFLDFSVGGVVRTATFTVDVAAGEVDP